MIIYKIMEKVKYSLMMERSFIKYWSHKLIEVAVIKGCLGMECLGRLLLWLIKINIT